MNNIDNFNIAVAEIFGQCYKEFPIRASLKVLDIGDSLKPDGDLDLNLSDVEYQIADSAIQWLIDAGYLWCGNKEGEYTFHDVTLTPKGLEVLNAMPENLLPYKTLGEQLSQGVKTLGKSAATTIVNTVLSNGVNMCMHGN